MVSCALKIFVKIIVHTRQFSRPSSSAAGRFAVAAVPEN
jgi:hypothetical protein